MSAGRPKKFNSPQELQEKSDAYFDYCDTTMIGDKPKPYTMSGLCVYLGICRDTLSEYGSKPEYSDTIKGIRSRVENYVEENSLVGTLNPTVSIFNLKNNFGWVDKHENENINKNYFENNPINFIPTNEHTNISETGKSSKGTK